MNFLSKVILYCMLISFAIALFLLTIVMVGNVDMHMYDNYDTNISEEMVEDYSTIKENE